MTLHVLPGDSLVKEFNAIGIDGDVIVCRECLVVGDVSGDTLEEFWERRANFIALEFGGDPIEYKENVAYELEQLIDPESGTEVNLWFEYELFCQVNMWFCLDLLKHTEAAVFRVAPLNASPDDVWNGFAGHGPAELLKSFESKVQFTSEDIMVGSRLWNAYKNKDAGSLLDLAGYRSPCFPFLAETCEAAANIDTRPAEVLRELRSIGIDDPETLFLEFKTRAGVYGFGDSQFERLLRSA
jgi:hypothetical protein